MEKTLTIDGKEVRFKSTGATPLRYKAQFRKDFFSEIIKLASLEKLKGLNTNNIDVDVLEGLDFEVMYNVAWVLAKTADPSIPEPLTWLDGFEEFPLMEIMPELIEMATLSLAKKKIDEQGTSDGETLTFETFLVLCYRYGLTKFDLEDMTIGMCLDYMYEYVEMEKPQEEKVRKASQADFDSF